MKISIRTICILAVLFGLVLSLGAASSDPARHAWLGGYEAMTLAEQEEKDHADLAALRHYEQALEIFEQVHHDYPDWNVSIITFRIDYCRQKIANIKEQNRQNTAFLSREELVAQLASDNAELQTCREKITVLETQLRETRDQLRLARAEAAAQTANEENIRILRGDREVLTAQVQRLTAELAAAQEDLRKNEAAAQSRELAECENADELRIRGELINAYIHEIKPGSSVAVVKNYYDDYKEIHIPLDSTLSPQRNAQKYFREYRKSDTRKKKLAEQLELGESDVEWLRSVADELSLAENDDDISRIREELVSEGFLRPAAVKNPKKPVKKPEYSFESITTSDGFKVYYGKNNMQNDALTMRFASNSDIWFHVRESFGAHVVLRLEGKEPTETAIYEAARVAALHSKSAEGTKVPVDYTEIRNVRKPKGAKPGKVFYVNFKTIIV